MQTGNRKCPRHLCCGSTQHHRWRQKTVRHVPRKLSALYVRFLLDKVHGSILCIVKENRHTIYAQTQQTNLSANHITEHVSGTACAIKNWQKKVGELL